MSRSKLHDFEILTRLGSGSFGTVYKVRRIVDDNLYVIKNVRIIELSFKEQSEAINEVQILAQLKSPFVVRYYDSFIEKECLHIVMEFCNRGDLQNLIKKAKEKNVTCLKEDVIWNISLQVILGLYYLHKKHILHRDLKSANVFLMKDDSKANYLVKIGDLGVAKLMDTSTALANTIVGTPYYLSPELCADMPYRDKSDCWAFGVLLYECCTLQHPFEARNQCALIMKIIEAQVKPPSSPSISAELVALIMWLLQKDPALRPSIKDVVNEDVVRRKIEQHNFEFPPELLQSPVTYHLSPKAPSQQPPVDKKSSFKSKVQHNEEAQSGNQRTVMTSAQRSGSGKMSSSGPDAPAAGVVRGDRVRGGSKRQLSDKVLTRHQVPRPMVSTSSRAAHTPPSHLDDEKTSGGDPMRRTQSKMTKEQDEFSRDLSGQNDGELANPKSRRDPLREDKDQKYESGGEQYEEEGFEEYDSHDDHPVHTYHDEDSVEVDKPLSTPRLPAHPTAAETLKSLKAGSSATWTNDFLSHPSHPLAATDMFHQTDGTTQSNPWNGNVEDSHDSSEWNPVWTENRGVIAGSHGKGVTLGGTRVAELGVAEQSIDEEDALQERESDLYDRAAYISTSQGSEDLGEEDDYEQQMEELLVHINDAKERAESTFGADLFGRVYQLLSNQMDMPIQTETQFDHNNTGELGPKGFNLVKELERSVSDSGHSLELACEAVFGVKVLLALESKYDKLKEMNFAFHK